MARIRKQCLRSVPGLPGTDCLLRGSVLPALLVGEGRQGLKLLLGRVHHGIPALVIGVVRQGNGSGVDKDVTVPHAEEAADRDDVADARPWLTTKSSISPTSSLAALRTSRSSGSVTGTWLGRSKVPQASTSQAETVA